MRRTSLLVVIGAVAAALAFLAWASAAHAHYGHSPVRSVAQHASTLAGNVHDTASVDAPSRRSLEFHAPGCPGDGSGNCCCTQDAHVPLPSSHFALPAAIERFATPAPVACRVVEVPATPVERPLVIGSRGSRGPPSA